jgi:hypothetical protein
MSQLQFLSSSGELVIGIHMVGLRKSRDYFGLSV